MAKTSAFHFKQFSIEQNKNSQKVGTDSMLLGAWSKGEFTSILDIGTGTGILSLMLAQYNPDSKIIALEPEENALQEAIQNFSNSPFKKNISGVHATLQVFESLDKFDLIISNPPYFQNSTLSDNEARNRSRHTNQLPVSEFYKCASELLEIHGVLNVIFPFELEKNHLEEARKFNLFPNKILRTKREDGCYKRSLVSYSFQNADPESTEMIVKFKNNTYSNEYILLTRDFYLTDLTVKQKGHTLNTK